jgi:hypothetical protein
MVSAKRVHAWEEAYRAYAAANEAVLRSRSVDADTASAMAAASAAVASTWRALAASARNQPWWIVAAVGSAAQAFEEQARHWETLRAKRERTGETSGRRRQVGPASGTMGKHAGWSVESGDLGDTGDRREHHHPGSSRAVKSADEFGE